MDTLAKEHDDVAFDGVICFGGVDWWYHNRGHYDLQMMRELSAQIPVLYVNSVGVRTPRPTERWMFVKRVIRKLRSVGRGSSEVRPGFAVLSPPTIPTTRRNPAIRPLTARAIKAGSRRLGMERPLVWVRCPGAAAFLDLIPHELLVYQRTDRFEAFPGVDPAQIIEDRRTLSAADLTRYGTRALFEEERTTCRNAVLVDHGIDYERFKDANGGPVPDDVKGTRRPIFGFVGDIDAHAFGPELFRDVVPRSPDLSSVPVDSCSLPDGWCTEPNAKLLGRKPHDEILAYMATFDALIMPWAQNDWIRACSPIKFKEHLGVGRPIVTTPVDVLEEYAGLVTIVEDATSFAHAIRAGLEVEHVPSAQRKRVSRETWAAKSDRVLEHLSGLVKAKVKSAPR